MSITLSKQAVKTLARLDTATRQRIQQGISRIPQGDIKPLQGAPGHFRLRVGDWRILFAYNDKDTVNIKKIGPRGEVYKGV